MNRHGSLGIHIGGGQMGAFPWPGPHTRALNGCSQIQIPQDLAVSSAPPTPPTLVCLGTLI